MPQQPESRSTTLHEGMRDSSALAGSNQPHRLLMTMTVQHDR